MTLRKAALGLVVAAASATGAAPQPRRPAAPLAICFAPGTPYDYVRNVYLSSRAAGVELFQFQDTARWDSTATNPSAPNQGQPITLTWSIVPDGTFIDSFGIGPAGPSNFVARMNSIHGSQAVWQPIIQQVFDRWHALTGVSYVFQPTDDGAAFPDSPGVLGVRGDVRIGGRNIDGNSGILAFNFFPDFGDMVVDTNDSFFTNTSNNNIRTRNVMAHEHGHGLGFSHVCPVNQTKLMEPFLSLAFDGPQHDDTLAGQRGYGDTRENNDTALTGTDLGTLSNGTTTVNDIGADDDSDQDFYRFTVGPGKKATITVTPVGFTYLEGPQNSNGTCSAGTTVNSLDDNDLGVELRDATGVTILASANSNPAGVAETLSNVPLVAGTSVIRVFPGGANTVQLYRLQVTIANNNPAITIGDAVVTEGDAGAVNAAFPVSLSGPTSDVITVSFATADGTAAAGTDYLTTLGTLTFTPGGATTQNIAVPVNGDLLDEADETFFVNLSNPVNATIADGQGLGTILDNDPPPMVSINDVTMAEGSGGGTTPFTFTASLSQTSGREVTVNFATSDDTAQAGSDYIAASGTVTFPPGSTTQPVTVMVVADMKFEANETFAVNLSGATNADIDDGAGTGTITNDDSAAARTFVSVTGDDANDCRNVSTPCRTFDQAIFQVAAGGEVIVLRTGSYGGATIDKSVKINAPTGVVAFAAASFNITAGVSDVVVLRGLTIKALTAGVGSGIVFNAGGALYVESCVIDGWNKGIDGVHPSPGGQIFVTDTIIRNSVAAGVQATTSRVSVDRSRFEGTSAGCGVDMQNIARGTVRNSVAAGNLNGFCATGDGSRIDVQRSLAANNAGSGVKAASSGLARAAQSMIVDNAVGLDNAGGTFESLGNNLVQGNGLDTSGTITVITGK
jgi:hypothetical protein